MEDRSLYAVAVEICGLTEAQALDLFSAIYPEVDQPSHGAPELWEMLGELYLQMQIEADRVGTRIDLAKRTPEDITLNVRSDRFPAGSIERIRVMAILTSLAIQDMDPETFAKLGKDTDLH